MEWESLCWEPTQPSGVRGMLRAGGVPGAGAAVQNLISQTQAPWC